MPTVVPSRSWCSRLQGAGLLCLLSAAALPALEEEWNFSLRPMNEHSVRLSVDVAVSDVHLDDFLELDSSFTAELSWHYEGLIEAHSWYGLVWGFGLAYTAQEGDFTLQEAELTAITPRVHIGLFGQFASNVRVGLVPFVGLGAAQLELTEKFPDALPFPESDAGSLWLEAGLRLDAVYQFAEKWQVGVAATMVHADGDFDFGGTDNFFDVRPVQDYFALGMTFGMRY